MVRIENQEDGTVRVCVEQNGFVSCGVVSSFHLTDPKINQLRKDIDRQAIEAYREFDDPLL